MAPPDRGGGEDVAGPAGAGESRQQQSEQADRPTAAGEEHDAERGQRDDGHVANPPRAHDGDSQRSEELHGDDHAQRSTRERFVEQQVHRRERQPEEREQRQLDPAKARAVERAEHQRGEQQPQAGRGGGPTSEMTCLASAAPICTETTALTTSSGAGALES